MLVLGLGCGARTSLEIAGDGSSSGDSGGSGGSQPPTAGNGGGTVEPIVCGELLVDGLPITVDSEPQEFEEHGPRLVGVDDERLMLFVTRTFAGAEAGDLHAATFDAWDAWPASLGPGNRIASAVRVGTAVGRGLAGDAVALLPLFSIGTPGAVLPAFASSVQPAQAYEEVPYSFQFLLGSLPQVPALALARSSSDVRLATVADTGVRFELVRTVVDIEGNQQSELDGSSGCADRPVIARAVETNDGVLTAMTSGKAYGACFADDGPPNPPTRLQIELADGLTGSLTHERTAPEPYAEIDLAATASGAWLAMRTDGSTSVTPPAVVVQRLSSAGAPGAEHTIIGDGETAGPLALGAVGEGFVVAYESSAETGEPLITVALFDADAELISRVDIEPETGALDDLSLAVSPSQRAFVVGWAGSAFETYARVARVSCN